MMPFFFNNLPKEVVDLAFVDGLGKEGKSLCEFINYARQDAVGKYSVSRLQYRKHIRARSE